MNKLETSSTVRFSLNSTTCVTATRRWLASGDAHHGYREQSRLGLKLHSIVRRQPPRASRCPDCARSRAARNARGPGNNAAARPAVPPINDGFHAAHYEHAGEFLQVLGGQRFEDEHGEHRPDGINHNALPFENRSRAAGRLDVSQERPDHCWPGDHAAISPSKMASGQERPRTQRIPERPDEPGDGGCPASPGCG